jgi:hypothetical protein
MANFPYKGIDPLPVYFGLPEHFIPNVVFHPVQDMIHHGD